MIQHQSDEGAKKILKAAHVYSTVITRYVYSEQHKGQLVIQVCRAYEADLKLTGGGRKTELLKRAGPVHWMRPKQSAMSMLLRINCGASDCSSKLVLT
jgi:hypothetical protein